MLQALCLIVGAHQAVTVGLRGIIGGDDQFKTESGAQGLRPTCFGRWLLQVQ